MSVDPVTAKHADIDGRTYYFCSPGCRNTFTPGTDSTAVTTLKGDL
jgi:YHS domain-containing protein